MPRCRAMKTRLVKIQKKWLELVTRIADKEAKQLFLVSCIGIALNGPQWPELNNIGGFSDPRLQRLWERTEIRQISEDKPGLIQLKRRSNGGDNN